MLVAVCVVAFHPGDNAVAAGRIAPVDKAAFDIAEAFFERHTQGVTVVACRNVDIFGIFGFFHIFVLKYFAVDIKAVGHEERKTFHSLAACGYVPEIISFSFGIERIGRQADMLRRVVAETAGAKVDEVVYILKIVILKIGIFGVYVGKSAHFAGRAFEAVVPLRDWFEAVGMEQILMAAHSIVKPRKNCGMIDCCMVRQDIDKHLYIVLVCAVAHSAEIVAVAEHVVSYLPVGRLIVVIPFAFNAVAGLRIEGHSAIFAYEAALHGRGLHVVIAGVGNTFHIGGNGVEAPRPCVENDFAFVVGRAAGIDCSRSERCCAKE